MKNITHIINFCFLLLHYHMCIFASWCDKRCFCFFFSQSKFHVNYARKLIIMLLTVTHDIVSKIMLKFFFMFNHRYFKIIAFKNP